MKMKARRQTGLIWNSSKRHNCFLNDNVSESLTKEDLLFIQASITAFVWQLVSDEKMADKGVLASYGA